MSSISNFPKTLTKYEQTFAFETFYEHRKLIEELAEKVSLLFAKLLTPKGYKQRDPTLPFTADPPSVFPPFVQAAAFKALLKEKIIKALMPDPSKFPSGLANYICLASDDIPVITLHDALVQSSFSSKVWDEIDRYFPMKTAVTIISKLNSQTIKVQIYDSRLV